MSSPSGHIVLQAYVFYGHHKPLCALGSKIVHARRIYITYLVPRPLYNKVISELARQFEPEESALRELIRVVPHEADNNPFNMSSANAPLRTLYTALAAGLPVPRAIGSEDLYPAIVPPSLAIIDTLSKEFMNIIREVSGSSVKVFLWDSSSTSSCYSLAASIERGGIFGDLDARLKVYEDQGASQEEVESIAEQSWNKRNDSIKLLPGVPPMYAYELNPQTSPFPELVVGASAILFRHLHNTFNEADGLVTMSSPYIEGPAIDAFKDWFTPRPVIAVAPLSPSVNQTEIDNARRDSVTFRETEKFLDDALNKHGENSVVFLSFGTVFWSTEPDKIWTFFDVLLELRIPVVFAHASPIASIPDEVLEKFDTSGLVYHSAWLPQQMILRHKATGWFVSHCGHNSVNESLAEGVPLICWPFMADQPIGAAQLTRLNVSYELFEVRTGEDGLRPIHRLGRAPVGTHEALCEEVREVMAKALGADGKEKRENAERIKSQITGCWSEGGYCWNEIHELINLALDDS